MPKKLGYTILIISVTIALISLFTFFIGPCKRIFTRYKNSLNKTTSHITLYSNTGTIIAKYSGSDLYVKSDNDLIEVHIGGQKLYFANVGVVIEEY